MLLRDQITPIFSDVLLLLLLFHVGVLKRAARYAFVLGP